MKTGVSSPPPIGVAIAAWVLPGAGHWWLGQRARAASFGLPLIALFVIALVISRGYAVSRTEHPLAFWLQLPAGASAFVGLALEPPTDGPAPSASGPAAPWQRRLLAGSEAAVHAPVVPPDDVVAVMDLALTYSMAAGLLNLLVIHDAWERAQRRTGAAAWR
ncbi:MAG: hypothetical protein D6776_01300 [Planctomycetota bacterium]|nr:MAG: hypothetical protein D6776_01300 [Planctomycetota bacterium]